MASLSLGIIGCGSMGSAIALGTLKASLSAQCAVENSSSTHTFTVGVYDLAETARPAIEQAGGTWWKSPTELTAACDIVLLAVKPYQVKAVIQEIRPVLTTGKTLLSIAAGQPLSALRQALGGTCPAVQIMPNTPAMIGEGAFALCLDDPSLPDDRKNAVCSLFAALGTVFIMPEHKMNAFSAVAGCGPAYVYAMMDAIIEAAVTLGFTRDEATRMTACLFKGSARMVEETGLAPGVLHGQVTSPGGMTIVGTNHLARTAVRGHIIDAVLAANARGKEMEKE